MNQINAEAIFRNKAYSYRSRTIVYALLEKIKIVYSLLGLSKLLLNLTSSPTKNLLRVCSGRTHEMSKAARSAKNSNNHNPSNGNCHERNSIQPQYIDIVASQGSGRDNSQTENQL